MTLLTLLPTSALAASSTGTGIKPTSNTNYWTTRLLHDGTPYSYKPPMAAGKMLYCLDRGYGYRWGTPSFLNSYTYTSATGADADAVLKTALAQSGMGELDAQQLENFKWMMSFIVDYTSMLLWFLAAGGDGHRLIFGGCDEVGAYMELTLWHNTAHAESFQFYLSDHPCPGYAEYRKGSAQIPLLHDRVALHEQQPEYLPASGAAEAKP